MNILDEITLDCLSDTKVLCDTPAKLKLRARTLEGINQNLKNTDTLPGLMLARKKKNVNLDEIKLQEVKPKEAKKSAVEETHSEMQNVVVNEEPKEKEDSFVTRFLDNVMVGDAKKLKLSSDKFDAIEEKGEKLMNETQSEEVKLEEVPEIASIKIDEIPAVYDDSTKGMENEPYHVEQGNVGTIDKVEKVEPKVRQIPSLDEIREKIIPFPTVNVEKVETPKKPEKVVTAYDRANADEMFKETSKLREEVATLKNEDKETMNRLNQSKMSYEQEINVSNELDKTYAERAREEREVERQFYEAISRQKDLLLDMKKTIAARNEATKKEIEDVSAKIDVVKSENTKKEENIREKDNTIAKYRNLLKAVQSLELPEVEEQNKVYGKVA